MRILKITGLSSLIFLVILTVVGSIYQIRAEISDRAYVPGELVAIKGGELHMLCQGTGSPLVLVENGLGASYAVWEQVMAGASKTTRICVYDRLGIGWSSQNDSPTRSVDVARNLNELLSAMSIEYPVVLVGWSAGGVFIRKFYADYPDRVAAMIFVDSSHEQQALRLPQRDSDNTLVNLCNLVAWTGIGRALGLLEQYVPDTLPPSAANEVVRLYNRTGFCAGVLNESIGFVEDVRSETPPSSLGDLPIIVLQQGKQLKVSDSVTQEFVDEFSRIWPIMQTELSALSSHSTLLTAEESGHSIPIDQPDIIVQSIERLVGELTLRQ